MSETVHDVVVIGGGPGGLNAALVLGRSRRSVLLIDSGNPRNAVTLEAHGFLTRDGIKPQEFRRIAQQQFQKYKNIKRIDGVVKYVEKPSFTFKVWTETGEVFQSRRVILATGMKDHLPDIPGLSEVYGKSVSHCPYCDGWERRDQPMAVFVSGTEVVNYTKLIYNWSQDLIVFTNGPERIDDDQKQELKKRNIPVVESAIVELQSDQGVLRKVITENGDGFCRTSGFMKYTGQKQAFQLSVSLGIHLNKRGGYEVNQHGQTSVKGLYVIGDAKNSFTGLVGAAGEGYEAGVTINDELVAEDW